MTSDEKLMWLLTIIACPLAVFMMPDEGEIPNDQD